MTADIPTIIVALYDLELLAKFYKLNILVSQEVGTVKIKFSKKWYQKMFPFFMNKRIHLFKTMVSELMMIGILVTYE